MSVSASSSPARGGAATKEGTVDTNILIAIAAILFIICMIVYLVRGRGI